MDTDLQPDEASPVHDNDIIEDLTRQLNATAHDLALRTEQAETQAQVVAKYKEDIEALNAKLTEATQANEILNARLMAIREQRNEASDRLAVMTTEAQALSILLQQHQQNVAQSEQAAAAELEAEIENAVDAQD